MDDSIFYRDGVNTNLRMRILKFARQSMLDLFLKSFRPSHSTTILDVGFSGEENEGANFLEKYYPWPRQITAAGLSDHTSIVNAYPDLAYVKIAPNQPLPFRDQQFDIAVSNAVLEHVGDIHDRQKFIRELVRVSKRVFITVPHRWFPFEHHTGLPVLHFFPNLFRAALKRGRYAHWTEPKNLEFLDRSKLLREWPEDVAKPTAILTTGLPLGPFSSNLAIMINQTD